MSVLRMSDLDLAGKRVLIREDLNVPIERDADGTARITSEQRIQTALPTLRMALEKGGAVMVTSHLGRPKEGVFSQGDSLEPSNEGGRKSTLDTRFSGRRRTPPRAH